MSTSIPIPDQGGVGLFSSATDYSLATRLDAVGYVGASVLYREGLGFIPNGDELTNNLQFSFVRDLSSGLPRDTDDNATDFLGVDTTGAQTSAGRRLGAPGPENTSSPIQHNATSKSALIDPMQLSTSPPHRVRDTTDTANGTFGSLTFRRKFTNNTGAPVTRLRFRIVDITTFPAPDPNTADLRARTSSDVVVTLTGGGTTTVRGTTLEQPPAQPSGGGLNSSLAAGTIMPLQPLAPGASINVQFVLGVEQAGNFRFFINVEAVP
jgi:hypothetical protein